MGCKFITMTSKDINATFKFALSEAPNYNVEFNGDVNGGKFTLQIFGNRLSGNFRSLSNRIEWELTQKPIFIPCKVIQAFIQKHV